MQEGDERFHQHYRAGQHTDDFEKAQTKQQWAFSKVQEVKTGKESFIASAHEEQHGAICVVAMHDRIF